MDSGTTEVCRVYRTSVFLSLIETSPRRTMVPHLTKAAAVYETNDTFWLLKW